MKLSAPVLATELSVTVTGISNDQGSLLLAMYNSADTFGGKRFNSVQSVAKSGDMRFTFNDLPAGDYSIMEGKTVFGPPTWTNTRFAVNAEISSLTIKLN